MPRLSARVSALRHLPDAFLNCKDRSIGHQWEQLNDGAWRSVVRKDGGVNLIREFRCVSCGTCKSQYFSHGLGGYLKRTSQDYDHPEGYSLPLDSDQGPLKAHEIWTEQFRRVRPTAYRQLRRDPQNVAES